MNRLCMASVLLLSLTASILVAVVSGLESPYKPGFRHECLHDEFQASIPVLQSDQPLHFVSEPSQDGKRSITATLVYEPLRILVYMGNVDPKGDAANGIGTDPMACQTVGQTIDSSRSSTGKYQCTAADIMTPEKITFLTDMLAQSADKLSHLNVVRLNTTMKTNSATQCGSVSIPATWRTDGVDYDFILLVSARPIPPAGYPNPTPGAGRTLATATTCQTNLIGRPILGLANFDPSSLSIGNAAAEGMQLGVAIHEISHSLGFTQSAFYDINRFKKRVGDTLVSYGSVSEIIKDINVADPNNPITALVTPKLLAEAKIHFNCDFVAQSTGVMLERSGGGGTAKSHWWKQILYDEYMTGTASSTPVFSRLTLALFEDSGWYLPDYSIADPLGWGRNQGCSFATQGCPAWPSGSGYKCAGELDKACLADYLSYGTCNPAGTLLLPCGYYQSATLCTFPFQGVNSSSQVDQTLAELVSAGEEFGKGARCFVSSLNRVDGVSDLIPIPGINTQRCYKTQCQSPTKLRVLVDGYGYLCKPEGNEVAASNYGGTITCAPKMNEVICQDSVEDSDWPEITSVEPIEGGPASTITIRGKNFNKTSIMEVSIESPCTNVVVIDDNTMSAVLAAAENYYSPRHLNLFGKSKSHVGIRDAYGRSDVLVDGFTVNVEFNLAYLQVLWLWITKNPAWACLAAAVILIPCIIICVCCYKKCKKNKKNKPKKGKFAYNYDDQADKYYFEEDVNAHANSNDVRVDVHSDRYERRY